MIKKLVIVVLQVLLFSSCSQSWLDLTPSNALSTDKAFQNVNDINYTLNGAYHNMLHSLYYGGEMLWISEVRANDMMSTVSGVRTSIEYRFNTTPDNVAVALWDQPYIVTKAANAVLANVSKIEVQNDNDKELLKRYKGEAYALRAFSLFDLTRLFAKPYKIDKGQSLGVPIVTGLLKPETKLKRNTVAECYKQIITDFTASLKLLENTGETGRITLDAAKALLARVYLYKGDDAKSLQLSEEVINNKKHKLLAYDDYVSSWYSGKSSESLFELITTVENNSGEEAMGYLLSPKGYGAFHLTSSYLKLISEIPSDIRQKINTDFNVAGSNEILKNAYLEKYPGREETNNISINNHIVIRLAEVYLNAAEAAFKVGDKQKALDYINTLIEKRTKVTGYYKLTDISLKHIMDERRKELVGEGHAFFDAMRDGETLTRDHDGFFGELSSVNWNNDKAILPIPTVELNANSLQQNKGY